jgi:hypothetical protein
MYVSCNMISGARRRRRCVVVSWRQCVLDTLWWIHPPGVSLVGRPSLLLLLLRALPPQGWGAWLCSYLLTHAAAGGVVGWFWLYIYVLYFLYVIGLGPPCGGSGIQHVNNGIESYGVGLQLFLGRVSPSPPARASARAKSGNEIKNVCFEYSIFKTVAIMISSPPNQRFLPAPPGLGSKFQKKLCSDKF